MIEQEEKYTSLSAFFKIYISAVVLSIFMFSISCGFGLYVEKQVQNILELQHNNIISPIIKFQGFLVGSIISGLFVSIIGISIWKLSKYRNKLLWFLANISGMIIGVFIIITCLYFISNFHLLFVFGGICAFASGSIIGLVQWTLLRTVVPLSKLWNDNLCYGGLKRLLAHDGTSYRYNADGTLLRVPQGDLPDGLLELAACRDTCKNLQQT